ncbi:MAG: DUF1345 domain-containing protein [Sphingomonadaceae bacterium]
MRLPHPRFLLFLGVLVGATLVAALRLPPEAAAIVGFDLAALLFVAGAAGLWAEDHPDRARARAARDDGGRVLLLAVAAAVLAAVLLALGQLIEGRARLSPADLAVVAGTLVLAWLFANLVFAFHYAHLYYDRKDGGDSGGIIFPEGGEPLFADFVYFAFVIGMTCQTADLDIASRTIRKAVTLHGLLAFLFNLGILALVVNVMAGVL